MVKTSTRIVGALALAGALVSSGPVLAAKPAKGGGPGLIGDLSDLRDSAEILVTVDCLASTTTGQINTATVSVYIFQSVGRLLNIGTGTYPPPPPPPLLPVEPLTCGDGTESAIVTVKAIPGLNFQPGPATILIKLTEQIIDVATGLPPLGAVPNVTETGARVDLRP
jgi:hypothetical protein